SVPSPQEYLGAYGDEYRVDAMYAYSREVAEPFYRVQLEFWQDPEAANRKWAEWEQAVLEKWREKNRFSMSDYRTFTAELAASDWRAAKAVVRGGLKAAGNDLVLMGQMLLDAATGNAPNVAIKLVTGQYVTPFDGPANPQEEAGATLFSVVSLATSAGIARQVPSLGRKVLTRTAHHLDDWERGWGVATNSGRAEIIAEARASSAY